MLPNVKSSRSFSSSSFFLQQSTSPASTLKQEESTEISTEEEDPRKIAMKQRLEEFIKETDETYSGSTQEFIGSAIKRAEIEKQYLALIKIYAKECNVRGIMNLFSELMENEFEIDVNAINTVVDGFADGNHLDQAIRFLEQMSHLNPGVRNVRVFNEMLLRKISNNDAQGMLSLLESCSDGSIPPNTKTLSLLRQQLVANTTIQEALKPILLSKVCEHLQPMIQYILNKQGNEIDIVATVERIARASAPLVVFAKPVDKEDLKMNVKGANKLEEHFEEFTKENALSCEDRDHLTPSFIMWSSFNKKTKV